MPRNLFRRIEGAFVFFYLGAAAGAGFAFMSGWVWSLIRRTCLQ